MAMVPSESIAHSSPADMGLISALIDMPFMVAAPGGAPGVGVGIVIEIILAGTAMCMIAIVSTVRLSKSARTMGAVSGWAGGVICPFGLNAGCTGRNCPRYTSRP